MAESDQAPAESSEEFDLDLADDKVEDETKNESEDIVQFNCTSYGADYTVDSLVKRLKSGAFFVPPFQRAYVWTQAQASRFIESMLLGLPVPGIFLYKEPTTNKHMVIDGQQRLRSLQFFSEGTFGERKFRLINISNRWEGKTWEELDESDRLKLDDSVVHATIFQQDEPKSGDQSIYYVFERINTGGLRLSSQEIRVCLNYGPFAGMLQELNKQAEWRSIFGAPSKRLKDQELILRFLAFFFEDIKYERPMNVYLNKFMEYHRELNVRSAEEFAKAFRETIGVIAAAIGPKAFRPVQSLNAAAFDSITVATARRLTSGPIKDLQSFKTQYEALLHNNDYLEIITRSTADEERVINRIKTAYLFIAKAR